MNKNTRANLLKSKDAKPRVYGAVLRRYDRLAAMDA